MSDLDLDQVDPTFVADLERSNGATWRVARWLQGLGYDAVVRAVKVRPDAAQRADYADDGDLHVLQRLEVKHTSAEFTGKADYPRDTIIVDVCHAYDRARPKPYAYVLLNKAGTHALTINCAATRASWERIERFNRGRQRQFYVCPIALCKEVTL